MTIHWLIYASKVMPSVSIEEVQNILSIARKNNAELGITGVLLCDTAYFLQALEGEAEVLQSVFKRIAKDPRHADVEILARGEIDQPRFSNWSMGFVDAATVLAGYPSDAGAGDYGKIGLTDVIENLRQAPEATGPFLDLCLECVQASRTLKI